MRLLTWSRHWKKNGASAPAPVAVAAAGGGGGGEAAPAEEKTEFDVVLTSDGGKKIQVIKAVREVKAGLGLAEAKDQEAPRRLFWKASPRTKPTAKAKLEEAGGAVELK